MAEVNTQSTKETLFYNATLNWLNDLAPQGIIVTDENLNIVCWNRWLEVHSKRNSGEMIGQNLFMAFVELNKRGFHKYYQEALAGQTRILSQRLHKYLISLEPVTIGTTFAQMQQSARISPLHHKDRVIGTLTLIEDVTDRTVREAALQEKIAEAKHLLKVAEEARTEAEEASRLKDEFLATLSHELRTPLNAILGWAKLLNQRVSTKEETFNGLKVIERNAQAQTQLVEDLLDVSRIITGKLRMEMNPIYLPEVAAAAVESIRPTAEAKNIKLEISLSVPNAFIAGDVDRIQQVIWNLLSNAIKFTSSGGSINVELEKSDSYIQLTVSDTGQGISEEFLPFVFDRFRQADSTYTRKLGGLGLGLSIVRHIVELHGGTVRVTSEGAERGTQFIVLLPAIAQDEIRQTTRTTEETSKDILSGAEKLLTGIYVLAVDDDGDTRELLKEILEQQGARVTVMSSVAEAFVAFQKEPPDILLSDLGMPNEGGYELISKVRACSDEQGGRVPAAALTGYTSIEDRLRTLNAGFQLHIAKPIFPDDLVKAVSQMAKRA